MPVASPEVFIALYDTDKLQTGIEIAGRMIKTINEESICDGVHIMAIGREAIVPDIIAAAGL